MHFPAIWIDARPEAPPVRVGKDAGAVDRLRLTEKRERGPPVFPLRLCGPSLGFPTFDHQTLHPSLLLFSRSCVALCQPVDRLPGWRKFR